MARLARVVIPDVPHHIAQRGNRFLSERQQADFARDIRAHETTGRPLGDSMFVEDLERLVERRLRPRRRAPRPGRSSASPAPKRSQLRLGVVGRDGGGS